MKYTNCLVAAVTSLCFLLLIGCHDKEEFEQRVAVMQNLERDLGFLHGTPYVNGEEVFMIERIDENGCFDKAGIKEGDIIENKISSREFFAMLEASRGELIDLSVRRKSEGTELLLSFSVEIPAHEVQASP